MKLSELILFIQVAERGSLSLAANELQLSQPNVSRTIRQLESSLNSELLRRTGRGVVLTPSGQRFLGFAQKVIAELEATKADIRKLDGTAPEKLRIYIPRHTGRLLMPAIFRTFHKEFPDIRLEILERQSTESNKALVAKECDAAVFYDHAPNQYPDHIRLFTESLYMTGHKKHLGESTDPITLAECTQLPLLLFSNPVYSAMVERAFEAENLRPNIIRKLENKVAVAAFAIEGDGVAIQAFSNFVSEFENHEIQARIIVEPEIQRHILGAAGAHLDRHFARTALQLLKSSLHDVASSARWQ